MNRKLIALAVGGVLGLPTLAVAQSTVQIYGRAHIEYAFTKQGGINEDQIHNGGGSNIGFRGTESLGGGLNAWFQCESSLQTQSGTNANGLCDRNSGAGLRGGFGNVSFGNWDLPMKWAGISGIKITDTGVFGTSGLLDHGAPTNVNNGGSSNAGTNVFGVNTAGVGTVRNNGAVNQGLTSFYRRQNNTLQYWTPNFGGFEARVGMSSANEETATNGLTPRTWSVGARYTNGPLLIAGGYEQHQDYRLAGRDDQGFMLGASYTFGAVRLGAMYQNMEYESFSTTAKGKNDVWAVFADWRISGPHSLQAQFVYADDTSGTLGAPGIPGAGGAATTGAPFIISQGTGSSMVYNGGAGGTGAKQYGIRYAYDFSKRTALRFAYTWIDNDTVARYGTYVTGATAPNAGETARAFGVAFDHRF